MDRQDREQSALLRPAQLCSPAVHQDVERAKQAELHDRLPLPGIPVNHRWSDLKSREMRSSSSGFQAPDSGLQALTARICSAKQTNRRQRTEVEALLKLLSLVTRTSSVHRTS